MRNVLNVEYDNVNMFMICNKKLAEFIIFLQQNMLKGFIPFKPQQFVNN